MPPIHEPAAKTPDVDEANVEDAFSERPRREVADESLSPSSFELVRRVVVGMVQAIEDGAELLGASVREELDRFRADAVKSLVAAILLVAGAGLLTAGIALLLRAWIGSWPPVLLALGGLYLVLGGWLLFSSTASRDQR